MPLASVLGHRGVLRLLARAVSRQSLPPSLLFAGPDGVGKFSTALALAQVLNCDSPRAGDDLAGLEVDACGVCPSCRRIGRAAEKLAAGQVAALDCLAVLRPDEKESIKVGPTRQLIERTAYRPLDGRRRLAVIDQADLLEVAAQNALLKVLEEPPPATAFVLISARPDALLPTIQSRCPRLRFGPLSADEVARFLVEQRGVEPRVARAAAVLGAGSLGRALGFAGGHSWEARQVALQALQSAVAARSASTRLEAARTLAAKADAESGRKTRSGDGVSRVVLADRLTALGVLLRDVYVLSTRADDRWLASSDLSADLAGLARRIGPERLSRAFAAVDRARAALERNASPKVVADWVALQL